MHTDPLMPLPYPIDAALARLRAAGYEAYIVGGAVRDALRGITPHDYDMTTSATPEEVKAVFSDERVIETGLRHGTVTVRLADCPIEITTYRIDGPYQDHRHPTEIRFTRSLKEDLARRDFTMNAIAYAPDVGYVDPFGGIGDIRRHVIRSVGKAETRFEEDALRILRAIRFSAVLGFSIVPDTAAAARNTCGLLSHVSGERIRDELMKMLVGAHVGAVLRSYADILVAPLPELRPLLSCPQHTPYHLYDAWEHTVRVVENLPQDPVLRLAGLYHDAGKPLCRSTDRNGQDHFYDHPKKSAELLDARMEALHLDRASRERARLLVLLHDHRFKPNDAKVLRLLSEIGYDRFVDYCALRTADNCAQNAEHPIIAQSAEQIADIATRGARLQAAGACYRIRDLAIDGRLLLAETSLRGHEVGDALRALLEAVMDGKVANEKTALLTYLRESPSLT